MVTGVAEQLVGAETSMAGQWGQHLTAGFPGEGRALTCVFPAFDYISSSNMVDFKQPV